MTKRKYWKKLSTNQLNKVLKQLREQKQKQCHCFGLVWS